MDRRTDDGGRVIRSSRHPSVTYGTLNIKAEVSAPAMWLSAGFPMAARVAPLWCRGLEGDRGAVAGCHIRSVHIVVYRRAIARPRDVASRQAPRRPRTAPPTMHCVWLCFDYRFIFWTVSCNAARDALPGCSRLHTALLSHYRYRPDETINEIK